MKGMPKILTWRILGTSLERTSRVDRSDPTVASAHSRSSSQVCSSRSSSRTRRGSEAPRVQNWSLSPRRSLGPRYARMRSPLPTTGRGSAPPSSETPAPPAAGAPGTSSAEGAGSRSPTSSGGASAISTSATTGGSTARTATASAEAGASIGNPPGGLEAAVTPAAPLGTTAASTEGSASGTRPTATRAASATRFGHLVRRPAGQRGPVQHWLQKSTPSCGPFWEPDRSNRASVCWVEREEQDQDTRRRSRDKGILRYLPTPGHDQSCLRGGPSSLDPRGHHRGLPRCRLRHHPCLGRSRHQRDGLPRRNHDDLRISLLCSRHGQRLLGNRRVDLTPRGHLNYLGLPLFFGLGP
jgi:hypothetical protein